MILKYPLPARFALIFCAGILILAGPVRAQSDDGMELLKQMSAAAHGLDYSGEFVYVKEGIISSMKIAHISATETRGSQQKLMALDGSMREIIQQDDEVECVLPDQGMGLREKRQARQLFTLNMSDKVENIGLFYRVDRIGSTRVANRNCEQVIVSPNDSYRYGYSLCIDSENQLLLSSELKTRDEEILESYKFIGVNFNKVETSAISSQTPPKTLSWIDDKPKDSVAIVSASEPGLKWRVRPNKSGFELEHYIKRISPVMQAEITHLVLGDGLAQVSVFISPADASANKSEAALSMGSINSHTRKVNNSMITAVGEVPRETVILIAEHTESY
ncbi:MAG: hypothetical protein GY726_09825 [Proteobacteria bacterium]|nr:hypothetical protein [Pseudomonadota bacterium]